MYRPPRLSPQKTTEPFAPIMRVRLLYGLLLVAMALFGIRLFYVQVIRYGYYKAAAFSDQFKQYQIPPARGIIEAHDGTNIVPIVLNQELYTLYADPVYIKNAGDTARKVAAIIGGGTNHYAELMRTPQTRYVVLARQLTGDQSERILALKIPGIGTQGQDYRTYPQGSLASQLLGFVDSEGKGQYGLEQALNTELAGTPGQVKAVTDVNGVPLAANKGNVQTAPVDGDDIVTTIDLAMQSHMEQILKDEYQKTKSSGLSAVIMDLHNGHIKAMANYPTYDPANYQSVTDQRLFQDAAVSNAIEPGSTMKALTVASALDQGVVQPDTTFFDPAHWLVDGFNITDIEEDGGAREQSISSILSLSLNTGATWLLMQMGRTGDNQINARGINAWHGYLTGHYFFGQPTNVEQGYESAGYVPPADMSQPAIALTYANTAFGQGIQVTALQMAAALSSVLNGGTYYQPTLVDQTIGPDGTAKAHGTHIVDTHVVKPETAAELIPLLENVVTTYRDEGFSYMSFPDGYIVGGKTGTAQVAKPAGGYYDDIYNGTYVGFVGGNAPQYVIVVFNIQPHVSGYAGSNAGQPVFADLTHMLIDNSFVAPAAP